MNQERVVKAGLLGLGTVGSGVCINLWNARRMKWH